MWETKFLEVMAETEFEHINFAYFASRTLEQELERNTHSVIPYFSISAAMMLVFVVLTCMMFDWVRSKPSLGFWGLVSAMMATGAAFGILMYLKVDFIGINLAAPFLMMGKY